MYPRRRTGLWAALIAGSLIFTTMPGALAQTTISDRQQAMSLWAEIAGLIEQGQCEAALERMKPLDRYFRAEGDDLRFRWNYAYCLESAQRYTEAIESYGLVIAQEAPAKTKEAARKQIDLLRRNRVGVLELDCLPAGARATLDSPHHAPTACPATWRDLETATYRVTLESPDGLHEEAEFRALAGRVSTHQLTMKSALVVRSPVEGSYVQVDGEYRGEAGRTEPLVIDGLTPGKHALHVTHPQGGRPWEVRLTVKPGQRRVVNAQLSGAEAPGPDRTWLWVGVGAGAAVAVGAAVAIFALSSDEPEVTHELDFAFSE